jgi:hypothetical protein
VPQRVALSGAGLCIAGWVGKFRSRKP